MEDSTVITMRVIAKVMDMESGSSWMVGGKTIRVIFLLIMG